MRGRCETSRSSPDGGSQIEKSKTDKRGPAGLELRALFAADSLHNN